MPDAKKLPPVHPSDVLLLTLVAGSADALGFLNLGKVFTSNMTGNVVLMGIALSEGRGADTLRSLFAFVAFVAGTCAGAWLWSFLVREKIRPAGITAVLGVEAVALLAYAVGSAWLGPARWADFAYPLIGTLGLSMGLQAAAVYRMGTPGVTTTAITGTLTTLFNSVMRSINLARGPQPATVPQASFALQAAVIVLYCGGAAIAGGLNLGAKAWAGFFPATVVVITIAWRLWRNRPASTNPG